MNCLECSESLIDYLEKTLPEERSEQIKSHLANCSGCRDEYATLISAWEGLDRLPKPNPAMKQRFSSAIAEYKKGQIEGRALAADEANNSRNLTTSIWRSGYAQAAAIAIAFILGSLVSRTDETAGNDDQRIAMIETELASLKEFTAISLLNQTSAADRLRGVEWIASSGISNVNTMDALYNKLSYDPNINVRFAALETLDVYAKSPEVRGKLVRLLEMPNSPMIRAELIKLLVRHEEVSSLPTLTRISQDEKENETIRELAKWSVDRLNTLNTSSSVQQI